MQKRIVVIFVFALLESILSYSIGGYGGYIDPYSLTLEQILSDMTFEIVPYPTYPNPGYLPYPSNPYLYLDGGCQCGMYPEFPGFYDPGLQYGLPYPCGNCFDNPFGDMCLPCNCFRDIRDPCLVCEDTAPLYICFEGCSVDYMPSPPYIYFPPVEYPMSAMDIRPYYYGQAWCA